MSEKADETKKAQETKNAERSNVRRFLFLVFNGRDFGARSESRKGER